MSEGEMSRNTLFDQNPQMVGNKGKDTVPEKKVSHILTSMGYRYRKNYSQLPGRPDFAFTKKKKVIFVNGCWWHLHAGCGDVRSAKTNRRFWDAKLGATAVRDERNRIDLARLGWEQMTIWSCELDEEEQLKKKLRNFLDTDSRRSIELFTGAGGLALAVSRNGFKHEALVEIDRQACEMLRFNQEREVPLLKDWPLFEMDVKNFDYKPYQDTIDLLGAGSPCQPFSLGGNHKAEEDVRNMFPEVIRAIRELRPKAVIVENVKGLKRAAFAEYFEYILLQIKHPELIARNNEDWQSHRVRLKAHDKSKPGGDLRYRVSETTLNAADYGVPQTRDRVLIVAFRQDIDGSWLFPPPTHGREMLLYKQWVTGEYWESHNLSKRQRPSAPERLAGQIKKLEVEPPDFNIRPWITVRDALRDLPNPQEKIGGGNASNGYFNHVLNPGARSYPGHTGSSSDWPSKTLKAGVHGVPGGENTLVVNHSKVRYYTVREAARIQTFPDEIVFPGAWTVGMRQLGNAVPVSLGDAVVQKIKDVLTSG